jgi:hypothetical protein
MADKNNNKPTIEKLDAMNAVREKIPFTTLPNSVLQNLKDAEALACWCYLQSMPPHWKVIKAAIRAHFGWGLNKVDKVFSTLNKLGLIEFIQTRKGNGMMGDFQIVIKTHGSFASSTGTIESIGTAITAPMETRGAENQGGGKPPGRLTGAINTISSSNTIRDKKTTTGDYFNDFEKMDLLNLRRLHNALTELDEEEVVEVFELHCKENEKLKGWVKPQAIKGIKTLIMQNTFMLRKDFVSKKQKAQREEEAKIKKQQFDDAQERQHQERMKNYTKSNGNTPQRKNAPFKLSEILKGKL